MRHLIKAFILITIVMFSFSTATFAGEGEQDRNRRVKSSKSENKNKKTETVKSTSRTRSTSSKSTPARNRNKTTVSSRRTTVEPKVNRTRSTRQKSPAVIQNSRTRSSESPNYDTRSRNTARINRAETEKRSRNSRVFQKQTTPDNRKRSDVVRKTNPASSRSGSYTPRTREVRRPQPSVTRTTVTRTRSKSPAVIDDRRNGRSNTTRPSSGGKVIRSRSRVVEEYSRTATARTRKGSYTPTRGSRAIEDRSRIGKVRMINRAVRDGKIGRALGVKGSDRWAYAKTDHARNNYRLVTRGRDGKRAINRHYLHHNDGRWGYSSSRYTGRNYHFYVSLSNDGWDFGAGYSRWGRRYYGDNWDVRFGWNSGSYIPSAYRSSGAYYFEPCYSFSFTFNHGYEKGYMEGYTRGVRDWNSQYPYQSIPGSYLGYQSRLGTYSEYTDGYGQGFSQGYYAGYSGLTYGYENFGFGDFRDYPVIYDFDYDYYDNNDYYSESRNDSGYNDNSYEYDRPNDGGYEYEEYENTEY